MIWLVNILTVIAAVYYAINLSLEKRAFLYSIALIIFGFFLHILQAFLNSAKGECDFDFTHNLLLTIDNCIDYQSGSMIIPQAIILAGFVVIFVRLALKANKQINQNQ
ncbi:hypothetical protein [Thalassotalea maritima]|uniref:hypothetical protein n=1 Tax=Thalassotalea maritima TaxID=3242416 RepID=UPI0035294E15